MRLLFELAGVLAAVVLARSFMPVRSLLAAVTLVTVAGSAFAFWSNVFVQGRGMIDEHRRDDRLTRAQALSLPGTAYGAREDVLAWADAHLPPQATVFLECPQPVACSNALANWITYRLEPRVFMDFPSQAQWVLVYNTPTTTLSARAGLMQYAPGFAIARRGG